MSLGNQERNISYVLPINRNISYALPINRNGEGQQH